ncbi:MAG TPA: hypothetical protein VG735_07970 [Caulobacterales bacterium]|nr:hypothetical protein [Caulobacterales bacterium]
MAQLFPRLRIVLDQRDVDAFAADCEAIIRRYGEEPAPHNRAAFEREIDRAEGVLTDCIDLVFDTRQGG